MKLRSHLIIRGGPLHTVCVCLIIQRAKLKCSTYSCVRVILHCSWREFHIIHGRKGRGRIYHDSTYSIYLLYNFKQQKRKKRKTGEIGRFLMNVSHPFLSVYVCVSVSNILSKGPPNRCLSRRIIIIKRFVVDENGSASLMPNRLNANGYLPKSNERNPRRYDMKHQNGI